ncbi:histone H2B [Trypanosoma cruzi]|nr:histone H2B [Trypanosoma cruzi]
MATPRAVVEPQKGRQEVAPQAEADVECLHQPLAQVDQQPYVDVRSDNEDCELVRERLFERLASRPHGGARQQEAHTGCTRAADGGALVLPADLAKHAMAEGTKAVSHASS